jgi:glycosyltransferase involved in cell wall biosynthesis
MNEPLVSVIVPVYNQQNHVEEAVRSILEQTHQNLELIIVDDGSSDESVKIIKEKFSSGVTLICQKNLGVSSAINAGLSEAKGELIALLGGDDVSLKQRVSNQVKLFESSSFDILFSRPYLINQQGDSIRDEDFPVFFGPEPEKDKLLTELFYKGNFLCAPSAMFRRRVLDTLGEFHRGLIQLQDYDYWLRALGAGFTVKLCPQGEVYYRRHENNLSAVERLSAANAETPFILERLLRVSRPEILRKAFVDVLRPLSINTTPLTPIEKMMILMSHPLEEVRLAAGTYILRLMEDGWIFEEEEKYGFNLITYLYNNLGENDRQA